MSEQVSKNDQAFVREINALGAETADAPLGMNVCEKCCVETECNESGNNIPRVCNKYLGSRVYFKCNIEKVPPLVDFLISMHNMEDVHG